MSSWNSLRDPKQLVREVFFAALQVRYPLLVQLSFAVHEAL